MLVLRSLQDNLDVNSRLLLLYTRGGKKFAKVDVDERRVCNQGDVLATHPRMVYVTIAVLTISSAVVMDVSGKVNIHESLTVRQAQIRIVFASIED